MADREAREVIAEALWDLWDDLDMRSAPDATHADRILGALAGAGISVGRYEQCFYGDGEPSLFHGQPVFRRVEGPQEREA